MDILAIALSGMNAQQQRINVAASNIANATTTGKVPGNTSASTASAGSTVYKPLSVSMTALMTENRAGGVRADVIENKNGYSLSYDPQNVNANSEGYIAVPNVDFAKESIDILQSKLLFKANASVIKTEKDMQEELLDILA